MEEHTGQRNTQIDQNDNTTLTETNYNDNDCHFPDSVQDTC